MFLLLLPLPSTLALLTRRSTTLWSWRAAGAFRVDHVGMRKLCRLAALAGVAGGRGGRPMVCCRAVGLARVWDWLLLVDAVVFRLSGGVYGGSVSWWDRLEWYEGASEADEFR